MRNTKGYKHWKNYQTGNAGHGYPHFDTPKVIPQGRPPNHIKEQVKTMARNSPFPFNEREMEIKLMVQDKAKQDDLARQEEIWKEKEWRWRRNER